jgi:AcrR family transcriptional regulator
MFRAMDSKAKRPKKERRTNVERTAETRGRLIDATIELLYRGGYALTTTISVARKARVSRGAMMHHFSSRAELLLVVAEHILSQQRRIRMERLSKIGPGLERFYAAADVSWDVQRSPSAIAFLEIIMATRSDPELHEGMQPLIKLIPQLRQQAAIRMAGDLPGKDLVKIQHLVRLHQAALRGLSIELMFSRDVADIEAARQLLIHYERTFVEEVLEGSKKSRRKTRN